MGSSADPLDETRDLLDREATVHAFTDLFAASGLVDVQQQTQRTLQFVTAAKRPDGQAIE